MRETSVSLIATRVCRNRDVRKWPRGLKSRLRFGPQPIIRRADRRLYNRKLRSEHKLLKIMDNHPLDWKNNSAKEYRLVSWLYRSVLPIIFRRIYCPLDRSVWDAIEHMYYSYLLVKRHARGNIRVDRLRYCHPWRSHSIKDPDSGPGEYPAICQALESTS